MSVLDDFETWPLVSRKYIEIFVRIVWQGSKTIFFLHLLMYFSVLSGLGLCPTAFLPPTFG